MRLEHNEQFDNEMSMPKTTIEQRIAAAELRADQHKNRAEKLRALQRRRARRLDARKKIILGGALLALHENPAIRDVMPLILAAVTRPSDRNTLREAKLI